MYYIAHINDSTKETQSVKEHSLATADLCGKFAIDELKGVAKAIGLLHDCGKYQPSFQQRIRGKDIRVEHSGCGAQIAQKYYQGPLALAMEFCIAGHHGGIPDGGGKVGSIQEGTLSNRLKRSFEDFNAWKEDLAIPELDEDVFCAYLEQGCQKDDSLRLERFSYVVRYLYSCLVDADSLDTAAACGVERHRPLHADFEACLAKVEEKLCSLSEQAQTELQRARTRIQGQAFQKVREDADIYLMNMPTGSGKTLASVKFALERAIRGKKRRIVYVIPYNGIIDQTVEEFQQLFGDDLEILRHQSSFSYEVGENDNDLDEDYRVAAIQAAENWDAPFIITTAVQFFESLHSNQRARLRKVHNMADSILVFDEAHLLPQSFMRACLSSIVWLTHSMGSEAIFLTATMPDFGKLIWLYALPESKICDLVEEKSDFQIFQKCDYAYLGQLDAERLLMEAAKYPSSLIIVNTRKEARTLYQSCGGDKYYLSTYLCGADRAKRIQEIRKRLKEEPERQITIISTSLVEAGIDMDVSAVFRELTGLDSILQAGGRCNREGRREKGHVFIFERMSDTEELDGDGKAKKIRLPDQDERRSITLSLLRRYPTIDSQDCIRDYYSRLFFHRQDGEQEQVKDEMQECTISKKCRNPYEMPFATYAKEFRIIPNEMISIAIPRDEKSKHCIQALKYGDTSMSRTLQPYLCSLHIWELEELKRQHVVEEYAGVYCLTNPDYYQEEYGISFEARDYCID